MDSLEKKCQDLLSSINNKDTKEFLYLRTSIVSEIEANDFISTYEDYLSIGKATIVILDEMQHRGETYKRVVLTALYSLVSVILTDKEDNDPQTAVASALLLILFSENKDFVGGEYIVSKVRSAEAAAHQTIGMMCVFYWKYILNKTTPKLLSRTQQRLQKALESTIRDNPDPSTRRKVIDFEYGNFESMLHDLPLDITLKYPGASFLEPEEIVLKVQSLFTSNLLYFKDSEPTINSRLRIDNNVDSKIKDKIETKKVSSNSGCFGILFLFIVTSILVIFSI